MDFSQVAVCGPHHPASGSGLWSGVRVKYGLGRSVILQQSFIACIACAFIQRYRARNVNTLFAGFIDLARKDGHLGACIA